MKTNLIKFISLCFMLFLSYGAFAQQTQNVGDVFTYTIVAEDATGNDIAWTVTGAPLDGWEVISGAATESFKVNWKKAGTYTVSFSETEDHGSSNLCITTKNLTVTVSDNFKVEIGDAAYAAKCSDDGGSTTTVSYILTKTNGADAYTFDWTTVGLLGTQKSDINVAGSGDTFTLDIVIDNPVGVNDESFTIQISNVKDGYGNDSTVSTDASASVTIYGRPDTGDIIY